jgi:uncharacterized protein YciI
VPLFALIRERGPAWDWSRPMRRQDAWVEHADYMDAAADDGFFVAGGPLGHEDTAARVLLVIDAPDVAAVEARIDADPWTPMQLLCTVSLEPWTVLVGEITTRDAR